MAVVADPRPGNAPPPEPLSKGRGASGPRRDLFRLVVEFAVFLVATVSLVGSAQSILKAQHTLGEDRIGLLDLSDRWAAAAASFGLRGNLETSLSEFMEEYRRFRAQPSVRRLLVEDPEFAALASHTDTALVRLSYAETRGRPEASGAAMFLEMSLRRMSDRAAAYARDRLNRSRTALYGLAVALAILGAFFIVSERRILLRAREESRSRAFSRAYIAAAEAERLRIARELHDAVAQDLAAAKLYCGLVAATAESPSADISRVGVLLERAIGELRDVCHGLRPAELDRLGIGEASAQLCADTSRDGPLDVEFSMEGLDEVQFDPDFEINFYRILQEGLTNVRRHSGAQHAFVRLCLARGRLSLEIEDDGAGPRGSVPGLGRTGMEERVKMLDGDFYFGASPRGGALLRASAPARLIREAL